jgi:CRP/FNR family transcriptional regulator, cyclic AMP receptor protein
MEKLTFAPGEAIYNTGDPSDRVYVIKSGRVELADIYPETGKQTAATLNVGKVFGEVELIDRRPRTSSALAGSDVKLIAFDHDELLDILFSHPENSLMLSRSTFDHLRKLYGSHSLESDLARLREEMHESIKQAVVNHESRVVKSHNGMLAIAGPIVVLVLLAITLQFTLH